MPLCNHRIRTFLSLPHASMSTFLRMKYFHRSVLFSTCISFSYMNLQSVKTPQHRVLWTERPADSASSWLETWVSHWTSLGLSPSSETQGWCWATSKSIFLRANCRFCPGSQFPFPLYKQRSEEFMPSVTVHSDPYSGLPGNILSFIRNHSWI